MRRTSHPDEREQGHETLRSGSEEQREGRRRRQRWARPPARLVLRLTSLDGPTVPGLQRAERLLGDGLSLSTVRGTILRRVVLKGVGASSWVGGENQRPACSFLLSTLPGTAGTARLLLVLAWERDLKRTS